MGGLAGLIHFRGERPETVVLDRMSARLTHRGPDGEGTFAEGPVALAHRRRELKPGRPHQPLIDGHLVLILDGWAYDTGPGLWNLLPPHLLMEAWKRHGPALTDVVDGAFAAAIWDRNTETLHLFRDRLGVRPLFWARRGSQFAFASELPALLEVPWVSRELARENLAEYLSFRVVHAPRTLLRDVHQLEAAHWLTVSAEEVHSRRYWTPTYAPVGTPRPADGEVVPLLQEAVDRAVRRRLVSEAPTALYLSGGLGSTAIAAATRRLHRHIPTFTIGFEDDPSSESPFAGRVARLLGLEHHDVHVGSTELASSFAAGVEALGHPVGTPAVFLQLLLARAVGAGHRLVLSGDGGEELFGGRMLDRLVHRLRLAWAFAALPYPTRRTLGVMLSFTESGRQISAPLDRFGLELGLGGSDLFDEGERRLLLRDSALVRPEMRRTVLAPFYADLDTDPINAILHAFLRSWVEEESLVRADRTAAASGLDVRFPLLDAEVVAMASALPGASKVRRVGGSLHTRWPLRAMLSGVIPPTLVHRPKRGMPAPLDPWLAGPGRLFMDERFAVLKQDRFDLWSALALDRLKRSVGHERGAGTRLWSLFILDAWLERLK